MVKPQLTVAARHLPPRSRPEAIRRRRLALQLESAAAKPLTVVCAPAGYGKTTALAQWVAATDRPIAWMSLGTRDNDPRWFAAGLIGALEEPLPGSFTAARRALDAGADVVDAVLPLLLRTLAYGAAANLAIVLDDYHLISNPVCHRLTADLVAGLPRGVAVIVTGRSEPPLRLARRRADDSVAEIGVTDLRFRDDEAAELLNGSLRLELRPEQIERVEFQVEGWAAGLALVATALRERPGSVDFLEALDGSRANVHAYLAEEVLASVRLELRDFLLQTSILTRLSAALCEAVTGDKEARRWFEEVRRVNLFATSLDPDGTWLRYHPIFAEALSTELGRRAPEQVEELHLRAADWFEGEGMPEDALEHAIAAGAGPRAAGLLAQTWFALIAERRLATLRDFLDRLPADHGPFGPLCEALDIMCLAFEGVDQRITADRAERLGAEHGDDPMVRALVDRILTVPFYGDIGRALEVGRGAWARSAGHPPEAQAQLAVLFAFVLWFAGQLDEARALLEPRLSLELPTFPKVWARSILSLIAADEGDGEEAERHARAATAAVEAVDGQTATEFTAVPYITGNALRMQGKLEEARRLISLGLAKEAQRPGSIGQALALTFDAQLALAERDRTRAGEAAAAARAIIDRYTDVGTLEPRLTEVELALDRPADHELLGSEPTPAEMRVLILLDSDRSLSEIADELYVSLNTVKSHTRRLYRRLGVRTREAAVLAAHDRGLLPDESAAPLG